MQFANLFADEQIVAQAARKLSWSHFIEVLPLKDDLQREFYITMAASGKWGRDRFFTISKRRDKIVIRIFNSGDVDIIVTEMAYDNFRISLLKYESEIDIDDAVAKLRKGIKLFIDVLFDKDMHILMDFMADTCLGAKWEECMDSYSNFLLEGVCE